MAINLKEIRKDGTVQGVGSLGETITSLCDSLKGVYAANGFVPPWTGYLAFENGVCVGTCAFKSPPLKGEVEIAYFTFPEFEGKGIATTMARMMIEIAARQDPSVLVTAQTLPKFNPSCSILQKLGFQHQGTFQHPEDGAVWVWHLVERS